MYKAILRSLPDISLFPVIAFLIFFIFFVMLFIWVIRMDKKGINYLASLPMDDDAPQTPFNKLD